MYWFVYTLAWSLYTPLHCLCHQTFSRYFTLQWLSGCFCLALSSTQWHSIGQSVEPWSWQLWEFASFTPQCVVFRSSKLHVKSMVSQRNSLLFVAKFQGCAAPKCLISLCDTGRLKSMAPVVTAHSNFFCPLQSDRGNKATSCGQYTLWHWSHQVTQQNEYFLAGDVCKVPVELCSPTAGLLMGCWRYIYDCDNTCWWKACYNSSQHYDKR